MTTPTFRDRGMGRLPAVDPRDRAFPMALFTTAAVELPRYRYWRAGAVLDQGQMPWCVAYAWSQWLRSAPIMSRPSQTEAEIYRAAQLVDEWPGQDYDGTSVRAGAKVLQAAGHIRSYLWAMDELTIRRQVLAFTPVVVGFSWHVNMFEPEDGFLSLGGGIAGGHAFLLIGYSTARRAYRVLNSWGREWGEEGRAWLRDEDVATLLADDGEACAAVEQRL